MFKLVQEVRDILRTAGFDWSICGGFAIDLFHESETRKHVDIDVCVFLENRSDVIRLMKNLDWTIYEYCGGGIVHLIFNVSEQKFPNNNIFCVMDGNTSLHVTDLGDNMYQHSFDQIEQKKFDFVDFLFNRREGDYIVFQRNPRIKRELSKAFSLYGDIHYLSPEIALLYKSMEGEREDREHDFNITLDVLDTERKTWLVNALEVCFPQGHKWLELMKEQ